MSALLPARPVVEWIEPGPVQIPAELEPVASEHLLTAQMLVRRGITTLSAARAFLDPSAYRPASPFDLPDMQPAVERIEKALRRGEHIGVWGDFDVDGQTSTTLLVDSLRALGGQVSYHIPVRAHESHGVSLPHLRDFLDGGVQVVVTCDTGITAHESAAYARTRGVDFIITDHHSLPPDLPDGYAVVNPQRLPAGHPSRSLPGVGTAYKLAEALCPEIAARQLDLAALGIVADLAILTGDARYLAQRGLEALHKTDRPGLLALLENAELNPEHLTEEHISFILAPRLNAIGRLDDANPVVEFFTTPDLPQARLLATTLEGLNARRKLISDQVFKAALAQIERSPALLDGAALVLAHPQWPAGVVGIVASRLVELYHRPAVLICAPPGELARGSARSVEGVNITTAISECADLLAGFGGHPMAAGLGLDGERIPELRRRLNEAVLRQTGGQEPALKLEIDAYLPLQQASLELVEALERLAPFGPGNPAPVFAARDLRLKESDHIGKGGEHLKLIVEDESGQFHEVIWWQGVEEGLPDGRFDLAYSLHASNFRGQPRTQVEWAGVRVREPAAIEVPGVEIQCSDYRREIDPARLLKSLPAGDILIWQEGENLSPLAGCDRTRLAPARVLAVWSIPPERSVLEEALKTVRPERVILFGVYPGSDRPSAFITRLAGLVRYAVNQNQGQVSLRRLAAATGQRETAVRRGLQWLAARGSLAISAEDGDALTILPEGKSTPELMRQREKELLFLLEETAAYRSYYLQADPQDLLRIR